MFYNILYTTEEGVLRTPSKFFTHAAYIGEATVQAAGDSQVSHETRTAEVSAASNTFLMGRKGMSALQCKCK